MRDVLLGRGGEVIGIYTEQQGFPGLDPRQPIGLEVITRAWRLPPDVKAWNAEKPLPPARGKRRR